MDGTTISNNLKDHRWHQEGKKHAADKKHKDDPVIHSQFMVDVAIDD